jgi:hypothetical protein
MQIMTGIRGLSRLEMGIISSRDDDKEKRPGKLAVSKYKYFGLNSSD